MKADPIMPAVLAPRDIAELPPKRKWLGYAAVTASLLISYALWLGAMAAADEWYDNPWKYPAKVGSHGALVLMCWAIILATRFRAVERLFGGLDKVYQAHRHIGEAAFGLILLHPVFLAVAAAETAGDFFRYWWFDGWVRTTGLIALTVLILLGALSFSRKIAYHWWKRSHDIFGLLLLLIVFHAVVSNGEIMRYPVLRVWHGMWVAAAFGAYAYIHVFYRFFGPRYEYVTASVEEVGDGITEVTLTPTGRRLQAQPGQFVYLSLKTDVVNKEPHPFSISSAPEAAGLRLSIKRLGDWTQGVAQLKLGQTARVWGPYGYFAKVLLEQPLLPVVMIGGGIGITPFLSIVLSAAFAKRRGRSTLIYAVPDQASAVYLPVLQERAQELAHFNVEVHLSDEAGYLDRGYLDRAVGQPLPECLFMVCGPPPLMAAMRTLLAEAGVEAKQVIVEDFEIR